MTDQGNNQVEQNSFAARFQKRSGSFSSSAISQNTPQHNSINDIMKQSESKKQQQETLSSIDPQKKAQAELIYLVKGVDAGRNAWYYVLVEKLKVQLFLKALNDEVIHLENYGQILYSGYGDEPPSFITDELKEEYGIA